MGDSHSSRHSGDRRHGLLRVTQNESVKMPLSGLRDSDGSRALLVLSGAV